MTFLAATNQPRRPGNVATEQLAQPIGQAVVLRIEEVVNLRREDRLVKNQQAELAQAWESKCRDTYINAFGRLEWMAPIRIAQRALKDSYRIRTLVVYGGSRPLTLTGASCAPGIYLLRKGSLKQELSRFGLRFCLYSVTPYMFFRGRHATIHDFRILFGWDSKQ